MPPAGRRVVVKVGGSLFNWPRLAVELNRWLDRQQSLSPKGTTFVLTAGGGELVDLVRRWQSLHGVDDRTCHWLSISLLNVTCDLLATVLPQARQLRDFALLREALSAADAPGSLYVFSPEDFLRDSAGLPENWDVTSDSIAASLAIAIQADELVLLKSATPAEAASVQALSDGQFVDRHLPRLAAQIPELSVVNLRQQATA